MRWSLVLIVMTVLIIANVVTGQQKTPAELQTTWDNADKNKDGYIDRIEYHGVMTDVFFFIDADKDGHLTLVEIRKISLKVDPNDFNAADNDGNTMVNIHEYHNALSKDFDAADQNSNGKISVEEFNGMHQTQ